MTDTDRRMLYFALLTHEEQCAAIQRMSASGMSDSTIGAATQLSVEMVRQIIGNRDNAAESGT